MVYYSDIEDKIFYDLKQIEENIVRESDEKAGENQLLDIIDLLDNSIDSQITQIISPFGNIYFYYNKKGEFSIISDSISLN